jgi:hypothetical protein
MRKRSPVRTKRMARQVSFRLLASFAVLIALVIASAGYRHGLAFNGYRVGGKTTRVKIDAFPRMSEKLIDRTTKPVTPVAIFGSDSFDAAKVNPSSVSLNGAQPMLASTGNIRHKVKDVDGDGRKDMLVYFQTKELKVANGDAMLAFQGETTDGSWIDGREAVRLTESPANALPAAATQFQQGQGSSAADQGKVPPITPDTGQVFQNPATILIPASGTGSTSGSASSLYPSNITVAGVPAAASYRITIQLFDLRHHSLDDVDMMVVNPAGVKYMFFSDVGGISNSTCGATCDNGVNLGTTGPTLTILDTASVFLQDTTLPTTGAFRPADYAGGTDTFPAGPPAGAVTSPGSTDTPTMNSTLGATSPNGTWSLYISDDASGDSGRLNSGWGLTIFTVTPTAAPADISGQITTPDGQPLAGTVVQLSGGSSDRTITDAQGRYKFEGVNTDNFYTLRPQRANFSFAPTERSFSLNANKSDAVFTANPNSSATANPLDTDLFFVRQQYLDFLGREPDGPGLKYWASELDKCGDDAACLNQRRIGISAAFFIESESQLTGSYIYRLYKGALGRQVSYAEFSADRPQVIGGESLEASRAAFAGQFVQRGEFMQKYSQATSAESFVDDLLMNIRQASGADLTGQRGALIAKYQSASEMNESRALVVREAIDNGAFQSAEYNKAFVTMEYFGYLRRDAEEGGYRFWLNVLENKEPGNYRGMVCSFITSAEYQERFSSYAGHSNQECSR